MKKVFGITFIAAGIVILAYGVMTYRSSETVLELGRLHVAAQSNGVLMWPSILGGITLLSGIALLVVGTSNATEVVIADRK